MTRSAKDRSAPARLVHLVAVLVLLVAAAPTLLAAQEESGEPEPREMDRFLEECGGEQESEEGHGDMEHGGEGQEESGSRFSDQCKPLEVIPERPRPIIELGQPFLGTGNIGDGFTLPTGAVWQPSLIFFGRLRTALQGGRFGLTDSELVEAVARIDLFGNLYLTQTERLVVGIRPLDQEGRFTSLTLSGPDDGPETDDFQNELNADVSTLFFEGDLNEIFPNLDKDDSGGGSLYFSVGRQPLGFQDGMLVGEDQLDMLGLTRANMKLFGAVNSRVTGVWAWGGINRLGAGPGGGVGNLADDDAQLFGIFTESDFRKTTLELDVAYVMGGELTGDGIHVALGDTRRIGRFSNTLRLLGSFAAGDELASNARGFLVHNQLGWTPHHSHDWWYVSTFLGFESYRPAAIGPSAGGALGRTGILFAAPGIGQIGAPLGGTADDAVGGAIGHQKFFDHTRQQFTLEVGARTRYSHPDGVQDGAAFEDVAGAGFRYQAAMGRRFVFVVDGIGTYDFGVDAETLADDQSELNLVGRVELQIAF